MSDLINEVAEKLGYPPVLVERSAQARAQAEGKEMDQVLAAWAGGESISTSSETATAENDSTKAATSSVTEDSENGSTTSATDPGLETSTDSVAPEPPIDTAPSAATGHIGQQAGSISQPESVPPPPQPIIQPAPIPEQLAAASALATHPQTAVPLRLRGRKAARYGLVLGLLSGLFIILAASPWLLPRAVVTGDIGSFTPGVEVAPGWLLLVLLVWGGVTGAVAAPLGRFGASWFGSGWRLVGSWSWSVTFGALTGLLGGALVGVFAAWGFSSDSVSREGWVVIPLLGGTAVVAVGMALVGWICAWVPQAVGVPEGGPAENPVEVSKVRRILSSAVTIPMVGGVVIAILVLPAAWLFISFPSYAPLMALVVAGGILGFAGLSSSRPGMKITWGEFLTAAAGIGVIVLIVVALLLVRGEGGHGGEEDHSTEEEVVAALQL